MNNDTPYALVVLVFLLLVISARGFSAGILELLTSLTRPGATILLLGSIVYLYSQGYLRTSLALALLSMFLLKSLWTTWPLSDERRLYLDLGADNARFDPRTSIDLQFANGSAIHDSPNMLHKDGDATPLLLYPPSDATLASLSG
jgi:hypothetical protein